MLVAFDIVKQEDEPVSGREVGDGLFERKAVDGTGESEVGGTKAASWAFFGGGFHGLVERDQLQALAAELHEDDIDGEAVEPGGKGGVAAEGGDFAVELEEGFLGEIFGLGAVADHAQAEGIDAALMEGEELGKGGMVAGLRTCEHGIGLCVGTGGGRQNIPVPGQTRCRGGVTFRLA